MTDRDDTMFEFGVDAFCDLISSTPADDPPGAIAAAAASIAVAAALVEKCAQSDTRAELASLRKQAFLLAAQDAKAYRDWRDGSTDSLAIEEYPRQLAEIGTQIAQIAKNAPSHPVVGETDLHAAMEIALGAAAAAEAVITGNLKHTPHKARNSRAQA